MQTVNRGWSESGAHTNERTSLNTITCHFSSAHRGPWLTFYKSHPLAYLLNSFTTVLPLGLLLPSISTTDDGLYRAPSGVCYLQKNMNVPILHPRNLPCVCRFHIIYKVIHDFAWRKRVKAQLHCRLREVWCLYVCFSEGAVQLYILYVKNTCHLAPLLWPPSDAWSISDVWWKWCRIYLFIYSLRTEIDLYLALLEVYLIYLTESVGHWDYKQIRTTGPSSAGWNFSCSQRSTCYK